MKRTIYVTAYADGSMSLGDSKRRIWRDNPDRYLTDYPVEIEIPDPPQEWKVGDWFRQPEGEPRRIIDINGTRVAYHYRHTDGLPVAFTCGVDDLITADPCDPPAWFAEGGAS